jgi:PAS domain S-box-containing protein
MDNFSGFQLSHEELRRRQQQRSQRRATNSGMNHMSQLPQQHMPLNQDSGMIGADSLDDIIRNNHNVMQRRRSLPQQPYGGQLSQSDADRRLSMVEFGEDDFSDYQFGMMNSPTGAMGSGFPSITTGMVLPGTTGNFSPQTLVTDDFANISTDMMGNMIAFQNMSMGQMSSDPSAMNLFPGFPPPAMNPVASGFAMDMTGDGSQIGTTPGTAASALVMESSDATLLATSQPFGPSGQPNQAHPRVNIDTTGMGAYQSSISPSQHHDIASQSSATVASSFQSPLTTSNTPDGLSDATMASTAIQPSPVVSGPLPPSKDQPKSIYSKTGFDMLKALWLVATRKNAQVNLGAVDMSCAFVVCDVTMNDCPIVYVSDNFQNLTGYSRHDIVGKNCRFLQAPDGLVDAGTKREFVDNGAVYNLKQKIAEGNEVQQSLINYRKGGKPFLNLLTMIPIPWDSTEIRYIVGFQIDLVECPDAIASSQQGPGSMKVNYMHSDIGQYIWTPPAVSQWEPETGQTLGMDDVSTLLQQFTPRGAVSDWHRQSWEKMLLENADDVVHVLSLKGLFLYLSPSCKRILEYDSTELVGTSISSICHPSDIVPVTRELKDTTTGSSVNIVFRIRRKQSGYTWFESHGSLFVEAGKGRKCIILVGRKRPVFALHRRDLEAHGGIGDSELWTKLSTSGMFLFVSSNVRSLLDLQPDSLVGTSIQELMRRESRPEFGRTIEKARRGKIVTCKHEVQNRRGQVLQAHTTLYPGDASEGQKPTFLLAQTKLLKASSRAIAPATSPLAKQGTAGSTSGEPKSIINLNLIQQANAAQKEAGAVGVGAAPPLGSQDLALASDDNIFDELKTTRCTSWQYELRQMEKVNRVLAEELHGLLSNKKKRKRRKGVGNVVRDCANCHTRNTPEWRRGPSGQRDLCNSCGLRWAKQVSQALPLSLCIPWAPRTHFYHSRRAESHPGTLREGARRILLAKSRRRRCTRRRSTGRCPPARPMHNRPSRTR